MDIFSYTAGGSCLRRFFGRCGIERKHREGVSARIMTFIPFPSVAAGFSRGLVFPATAEKGSANGIVIILSFS